MSEPEAKTLTPGMIIGDPSPSSRASGDAIYDEIVQARTAVESAFRRCITFVLDVLLAVSLLGQVGIMFFNVE